MSTSQRCDDRLIPPWDTPVSEGFAPGGKRTFRTDQRFPSHRSAGPYGAIAMQALSDAHGTWLCASGVRCTDHVDPFQCSTSTTFSSPVGLSGNASPTDVHERGELHDTSLNMA